MAEPRVAIIGAGLGGLAAAIDLARQGAAVTVCERAATAGGKMRTVMVAGRAIDAGPTVFTLRPVLDGLFADAGARRADHLTLERLEVLARHGWADGSRLDLFADPDRSAAAIGAFAGAAEAAAYRRFVARAAETFHLLEAPFLCTERPSVLGLVRAAGPAGWRGLSRAAPFETLWAALGGLFADPRLRQLFGRYATYCGASPFQATATLMLIAHAEQAGVDRVAGGMQAVAEALAALAERCGARLRYATEVAEILVRGGRAGGVRLADGAVLEADAVLCNADHLALGAGGFGAAAARAVPRTPPAERSLSALTWAMVADTDGLALQHHTVLFGRDYAEEFDAVFRRRAFPADPTVYLCAQDRDRQGALTVAGPERLLVLVNAPPTGDGGGPTATEIKACEAATWAVMRRAGLTVRPAAPPVITGPAQFERMFPHTGGALYGRALHGTMASFQRPGAMTRLPGLYLAGGGAHPGAGVPMALLSGRIAAARLLADRALISRPVRVAMPGGMSMG